MTKSISVRYSLAENDTFFVNVVYYVDTCNDRVTYIHCSIEAAPPEIIPAWLRAKKFEAKAMLAKGYYTLLYNESHYMHGLDTSLFIETATAQIMKQERMRQVS